jgi:hypothetical protein
MTEAKDAAAQDQLTPRQQKWFATVKANFEAKTGKSLAEWVAIAKTCPHDKPRARTDWLREHHGLGINHASFVMGEAFPSTSPSWDDPAALRKLLWADAGSLAILEAVEAAAKDLDDVVNGQRKGYTAFSKDVQFAAMRPLKGGRALLGLKLDPATSPRLTPSVRKESWSERLSAIVELDKPADVDVEIKALFAQAWGRG